MFARFRPSPYWLQVSIVETHRVGGKVRHEHIASLGSIETPLSFANRVAFWQRVHERLAKLSNRIDPATQGKIRGDIHTQIPMVTPARCPAAICRGAARTCTAMPWPRRAARCRRGVWRAAHGRGAIGGLRWAPPAGQGPRPRSAGEPAGPALRSMPCGARCR
jgi:hypothetical protein